MITFEKLVALSADALDAMECAKLHKVALDALLARVGGMQITRPAMDALASEVSTDAVRVHYGTGHDNNGKVYRRFYISAADRMGDYSRCELVISEARTGEDSMKARKVTPDMLERMKQEAARHYDYAAQRFAKVEAFAKVYRDYAETCAKYAAAMAAFNPPDLEVSCLRNRYATPGADEAEAAAREWLAGLMDQPKPAEEPAPVETVETAPAAEPVEPAAAVETVETVPVAVEAAAEPAPAVEAKPAAIPPKPWIGSTLQGNGFRVVFDADADRTRVILDDGAPADLGDRIAAAGWFYNARMGSYNKKLTHRAHRAALELVQSIA